MRKVNEENFVKDLKERLLQSADEHHNVNVHIITSSGIESHGTFRADGVSLEGHCITAESIGDACFYICMNQADLMVDDDSYIVKNEGAEVYLDFY